MTQFEQIQRILDDIVQWDSFGGHGPFWRDVTRDEFVQLNIFGFPLLKIGAASESNLVKALLGEVPFGQDIGTPGAMIRRMPAGRAAATEEQVRFIASWIDDGCPATELLQPANFLPRSASAHNDYWREFDDWAMFNATREVRDAENLVMNLASTVWFSFAKGHLTESNWSNAIARPDALDAYRLLSTLQKNTAEKYYGSPLDEAAIFESFVEFGKGALPLDPARPADPNHKMNGPSMWFYWASVADACIRSQIDSPFWDMFARAIIIGQMHDGLFRRRFTVVGFQATAADSTRIVQLYSTISSQQIVPELSKKYVESGI